MRSLLGLLAILAIAGTMPSASGQEAAAELPIALCESCHGRDGASATPDIPSIGGQNEPYLFESLRELKSERSSSPAMQAILRERPEEELRALARHFATRPYARRTQEVDATKTARGREAYERLCQICHHDEGRSTTYAEYPLLAGQDLSYMLRTIRTILDGKRRVDAIKRDLLVLAKQDQIDDAIHFFASQKVAPGDVKTALMSGPERKSRRNRFRTN